MAEYTLPNGLEVNISEETSKAILDKIGDKMAEKGLDQTAKDAEVLRAAADVFIEKMDSLNDDMKIQKQALQRNYDLRQSLKSYLKDKEQGLTSKKVETMVREITGKAKNFSTEYSDNYATAHSFLESSEGQEKLRTFYQNVFDFQNIVNKFLDQDVVMILVIENAEGADLYRIKKTDILDFGVGEKDFEARYRVAARQLETLLQTGVLEKEDKLKDLDGLDPTYKESLRRFRISKSHNNHIILWELPKGTWSHISVTGEGDINEAYATFALIPDRWNPILPGEESRIEYYALHGIAEVDSESGLLAGDATLRKIQYGIKSLDASTLGVKQVRDLAVKLRQKSSVETIKAKKDEFHEQIFNVAGRQKNPRNKVTQGLTQTAVNNVQDIIDDIRADHEVSYYF